MYLHTNQAIEPHFASVFPPAPDSLTANEVNLLVVSRAPLVGGHVLLKGKVVITLNGVVALMFCSCFACTSEVGPSVRFRWCNILLSST